MRKLLVSLILLIGSLETHSQIDTLLICDPSDVVQLMATPGRLGYMWSPSLGLDDPTIFDPIANPTSNTLYVVEMIGDVIGDNLITNPGFEDGNVGFESDYPFGEVIFTQGVYGVSTNAAELNGAFFTACPDQTSGDGMMMMVLLSQDRKFGARL